MHGTNGTGGRRRGKNGEVLARIDQFWSARQLGRLQSAHGAGGRLSGILAPFAGDRRKSWPLRHLDADRTQSRASARPNCRKPMAATSPALPRSSRIWCGAVSSSAIAWTSDRRTYRLNVTPAGKKTLTMMTRCARRHERNLDHVIGAARPQTFHPDFEEDRCRDRVARRANRQNFAQHRLRNRMRFEPAVRDRAPPRPAFPRHSTQISPLSLAGARRRSWSGRRRSWFRPSRRRRTALA